MKIPLSRTAIVLLVTALLAVSVGYYQQRQELRDSQQDIEGLAINLGEANKTMERLEVEQDTLKARLREAQFRFENEESRSAFTERRSPFMVR